VSRVSLSPAAREDLIAIWEFIARDNLGAATRVVDEFQQAFDQLTQMPEMGHRLEDLAPEPFRFWTVRAYVTVYRPRDGGIEVARIIHGARDLPSVLNE
jgi:toxin ParE1/3/4